LIKPGIEARKAQKKLMNILEEHLEINMRNVDDNTKMDITSFVFSLNSSLQHGQSRIFEKLMRLFCITNN